MTGKLTRKLQEKFQEKMPRMYAVVSSRPLDNTGKSLGYVLCTIAGQTNVRVTIGPNDVYYPGDGLLVEGRGTPAATTYVALGLQSYVRPSSGAIEFSDTTTVGNHEYDIGDLIWGDPFGAHFWFDYSDGVIYLMTQEQMNGAIRTSGVIDLGNTSGVHMHMTSTGIEWKSGTTVLSGIDGEGRTIFGFERLGRPLGPSIEWRETEDASGNLRFVFQGLGLNGVPWFSFVSGTDNDPDDYKFYLGPVGGTSRIIYQDGGLRITTSSTDEAAVISAITSGTSTAAMGVYGQGAVGVKGYSATGRGVIGITGQTVFAGGELFSGVYGEGYYNAIYGKATANATNAIGIEGVDSGTGDGIGVKGTGNVGVYATGRTYSLQCASKPATFGGQNLLNISYIYCNRVYIGDGTHYLYKSGNNLYWYNGSAGVQLD